MGRLKRYTFHILAMMILAPLAFTGARTTVSEISMQLPELPALDVQSQQVHALELSSEAELGDRDLRKAVLKVVKTSVPAKFHHRAYEIARAVIMEANRNQMDPFFLLAMIKTESHFNIKARGLHGEIGLMQIRPETANWLADRVGLIPGKFNLEDPRTNIRIGAAYVASLRREFGGHSARYIGAYNMGSANVYKLISANLDPSIYPGKVLNNYRGFHRAAVKFLEETGRSPAMVAQTKNFRAPKKLQTRNVINRCGTVRCRVLRHQPPMPGWTAT